MSETTDVVIVGAGPTGLLLAIELVLGGARVVVVERLMERDLTVKAGAMGALAGEALERRGLRATIAAEEQRGRSAMTAMAKMPNASFSAPLPWQKIGGHFAGLFLIDQSRQREPGRRFRGVRQQALEKMLVDRAQELGIEVRTGVEVQDFTESAEGVEVRAQGPEGELRFSCAYLVGCDGGRSAIRKRAGFEFPGTDPTLTGHQAIVELDYPDRLLPLGWRRTPRGMMAYGPVPGRVITVEFDGPPADRTSPITMEEVERSLRWVSGADVRILSMESATRFTDHARQVTSYRHGRILLAGDAAHVHSPFGGQGLNLGLLDAVNLGWKLAAVARGRQPESLLDTYTAERHPVGARVLANTRAQVALMRPDEMTTALREIVADLMSLEEGTRFFGEMMSGLTERYPLGEGHAQLGRICGNIAIPTEDGPEDLTTLMLDGNALLIDAGGQGSPLREIAAAWWPRVRVVRATQGPSMLLRPDACIAWISEESDAAGLKAALEQWFGLPLVPAG